MPSRSPHARLSPSTSTHTATPVKSEPGEDGKGKPKNFVCDKCGKRYARRDYLERHALNHEARSYKCNACGKGFARIDVLKKHEAVACKMLRPYGHQDLASNAVASSSRPVSSNGPSRHQGYSQASTTVGGRSRMKASRTNAPVATNANSNASVGAGRKRQKREETVEAESSVSSSEEDELEPDTHYDRRFSTDTIHHAGHHHLPQPPPHHPPTPGATYEYHQDEHTQLYAQHQHQHQYQHRTQAVSDSRMNPSSHLPPIHTHTAPTGTYELISPTQKDMSMSLAPAYAPTPEVNDLPGDSAPIRINTDIHSMPVMNHSMVDQHQPLSAHTHAHPGDAPTEWDSVGGAGNESDFGMPAKVGENMDDLLGWLFNTNAPGTGGDWSFGIQQGQIQQDMQGQHFLPTFSNDPTANSNSNTIPTGPLNYSPVDPHDTSQGYPPLSTKQHQSQIPQWIPPSDLRQEMYNDNPNEPGSTMRTSIPDDQHRYSQSSSSTTHRRYPQAFHPLYVPHIPGKTSIPNFSGSEKILIQGREKYKEVIDEEVHEAMLDMFEGAGKRELMSPAFSIQRMRLYLELYFMHFAPLYPIIHQPSLRFRRLPPDLLLALICIGTAFAEDKEGLRIASKIHKRLRNRIFEMVEDEPKASVHSLQTLLLINHFSRSYCSLKEHDISQIFHSPSVYMIRLAGTLLPKFNRQNTVSDDPVTCWLDWVCEEERKRLGWFAFMMDLENAALYRHFLMIHCYFMEIPFPTSSSSWTAPDPFSWSTALRESLSVPTPSFRNALRELAGRGQVPANLNDQSLWILIHGLINVSWTLLWRDLGELSMVHENKITGWKDSLRRAFKTWVGHVEGRAAVCEEALYTVGIPFAQLGSILLLSDTEEIRIFAGASNIAGRSISPGEWTAANTYVHAWARSQDGAYACYTAVELLSQVYKWSAEDRWATAPAFIPWCTYVSSLIIWAYSTVLDGPDSLQAPYIIPMTNNADKPLEHGQTSEIRIEPSLARRAAQSYLATMLRQTQGEPFALPDVQGKNACAGVLAYTAYLMGIGGRGVLDEARRVLLGLLGEG